MSIERKYQVFVSSTYNDLRVEREKVQQALLESDCIPIGMEMFPPSDETSWEYIKRVIDQCDYYVLILGGRYGSIDKASGYSYTEKEYRYADSIKKPIIAFYHQDPSTLPTNMTEKDPQKQKRLEAFRQLVFSKLCKGYRNPDELSACVMAGISNLKKIRPDGGWIPARYLPSESVQNELDTLRSENLALRAELEKEKSGQGAIHAIDSMINHIEARRSMKAYLGESLRKTDTVHVRVIAVSLFFTWDFLSNQIPILLSQAPSHKKILLEMVMIQPDYLGLLGLKDWQTKGKHVEEDISTFISEDSIAGKWIESGRLELTLHQYHNIPHWHGMLISNNFLFLGRTRWTIEPSSKICQLTVGEEIYRLFAMNDDFGGADRIDMFNSWFDYYRYSGKIVASANVRGE